MQTSGICSAEQTCVCMLTDRYESGGAGLIRTADAYAAVMDTLACGGIGATGGGS